jgi:hypothetical protein
MTQTAHTDGTHDTRDTARQWLITHISLPLLPLGDRTTEAIAECKMLQVVRLSYCENLTSQALVNLATLPHAEVRPQPLQLSFDMRPLTSPWLSVTTRHDTHTHTHDRSWTCGSAVGWATPGCWPSCAPTA